VYVQTGPEAASFDARAIEAVGVPQPVLMENAGRSAALVLRRAFQPRRVVGLVGTGNNGGDALVALRSLAAWGMDVEGVVVGDRPRHDPLLHGWSVPLTSDTEMDDDAWDRFFARADVVVDGLLGTGVRGAPREPQARVIEKVTAAGVPVVALDVPSGVDASTGEVAGAAVRAALTVSFGAPKLGALLHPGRGHVGRHVCVEIGFPPLAGGEAVAVAVTPSWARSRLPRRGTDTHKNRVGRVLIVGGTVGMAGAVVLAARSAFRTGAGLVRVCTSDANREIIQSALPEAIHVAAEPAALADAIGLSDAVAVGPGLGRDAAARDVLRLAVTDTGGPPLLLDADALNLAAEGVLSLSAVAASRPVLITPHPGEMQRLLGSADSPGGAPGAPSGGFPDGIPDGSRLRELAAAVERFGCSVLYKGAPSLVADPEGLLLVDTQSSSDLAVAGMGDTLAGVCAALLAQGVGASTAGALGLYLSGRAAQRARLGAGLTPSDVVQGLADVFTEPGPVPSDLDFPFVTFDADPAR
jgi:NAD(P)H-hydrate epimerase